MSIHFASPPHPGALPPHPPVAYASLRPRRPPPTWLWARIVGSTVAVAVVAATAATRGAHRVTTTTVSGQSTSGLNDPFRVGGLPAVDGPSGSSTGRARTRRRGETPTAVTPTTSHRWPPTTSRTSGRHELRGSCTGPSDPSKFVSYDSADPTTPEVCGSSPYGNPNAFFCPPTDLIAWDRGAMVPAGEKYFGPCRSPP